MSMSNWRKEGWILFFCFQVTAHHTDGSLSPRWTEHQDKPTSEILISICFCHYYTCSSGIYRMPPCCTAILWHPLETWLGALSRSAFCLAWMLLATFWTLFIFTKHFTLTEVLFHLGLGFEFCITLFLHRFHSELVNLNVFERAVHTGLHLTLYCSFCISMKGGFSPTL